MRLFFLVFIFLFSPFLRADKCSEAYFEMARENTYRVNEILQTTSTLVDELEHELSQRSVILDTRNVEQWVKELEKEFGAMKFGFYAVESDVKQAKATLDEIDARLARFVAQRQVSYQLWRPALMRCLEKNDEPHAEIASRFSDASEEYQVEVEVMMFSNKKLNKQREIYQRMKLLIDDVRSRVSSDK